MLSSPLTGLTVLLAGIYALVPPPSPGPDLLSRGGSDNNGPHTPIWQRSAAEVIAQLNLTANPEKGYYVQTFVDPNNVTFVTTTSNGTSYTTDRAASTLIYYLLEGSEGDSRWHRVDAVEVWHHYAGAPLALSLWRQDEDDAVTRVVLGADVFDGQTPQWPIGPWEWQSARSLGNWSLIGTTVAPGFVESGYEIAPDGWQPAST